MYLLCSMMLYSERSQAPSTKSPHTALSSIGDEKVVEEEESKNKMEVSKVLMAAFLTQTMTMTKR